MAKPKNSQKTGGRKKGTPNAVTASLRAAIRAANPDRFLIEVMNTGRVPTYDIETGEPTGEYEQALPTERVRVAMALSKKITPDAKERPIEFDIGQLDGIEGAQNAIARAIEAMSRGDITPSETNAVCGVIHHYVKAYETNELAAQLAVIEEKLIMGGMIKGAL